MVRLIDPSLNKLSLIMSEMGNMVTECISFAVDSYLRGENTTSKVYYLSCEIRKKYFEVEDIIFEILLKYQPVADDFRLIRSSTEISYAFSRLGRYAFDIAQVRDLFGDISKCREMELTEVSARVKHIIGEAVLSFAELDVRRAVKIQEDEDFIDRIYRERLPKLIASSNVRCAMAEALLLRYLERIGDHAMFMSDAVNYIVTGKHKPNERIIENNSDAFGS